jgi:protein-disulfide isomerase
MSYFRAVATVLVAGTMWTGAGAQARDANRDSQSSTPNQHFNEQVLAELRSIRALLEKLAAGQPTPPAPAPSRPAPSVRLTNVTGFTLGRSDAPLTMVEFTDLQCPFCRQFALSTFDALKREWIDTGKLRYVSRDFPLDFHGEAMAAARAARCAGEQGKFWEMRLELLRNADKLSGEYISSVAAAMNLNVATFAKCDSSPQPDAAIRADLEDGMKAGVSGTPSFVIGKTTNGATEGPLLIGAVPYPQLDAKLKELIVSVQ